MFWFFFNLIILLSVLVLDKIVGPTVDIINFISMALGVSRDMGLSIVAFMGVGAAVLSVLYTNNETIRTLSVFMGLYFLWLSYSHGAFFWVPRALQDIMHG